MNILVFNAGSSSLKYRLITLPQEIEVVSGEAQRIGPRTAEPARIVHRRDGAEQTFEVEMADHAAAFEQVALLLEREAVPTPDAIGHRIVHGGDQFRQHCVIDDAVLAKLTEIQHLAPIHLPPALRLVRACRERYGELPEIAIFDTAFHATIPDYAYTYALPKDIRETYGFRKYGFHGISHSYVATEAAKLLGRPMETLNAVVCHLGSGGASLCAVRGGQSQDNTMGFSPLQGLVMSTRCGDLDPAIALHMLTTRLGDCQSVEKALNGNSGVLGMSGGWSADIRDLLKGRHEHPEAAQLGSVVEVYLWRIRKYIGAYLAVAHPAQAIVFTDTIGELVPSVRKAVCEGLTELGIEVDDAVNENVTQWPVDIATANSAVRLLVIQTNEELAIARESGRVLQAVDPHKKTEPMKL